MKEIKIRTDADKLLNLVESRGRISLKEASKILKEDEKVIEELAKVLHENELLELVYPANPFVQPFIRIKKKEVKKEEKKIEKKPIGRKISLKIPISLDKIKEIIIKPKKFEPEKKKVK